MIDKIKSQYRYTFLIEFTVHVVLKSSTFESTCQVGLQLMDDIELHILEFMLIYVGVYTCVYFLVRLNICLDLPRNEIKIVCKVFHSMECGRIHVFIFW